MDLQTPEPEFGCRTPDSQTPEPRNLILDSGPPPTLLANRAMSGPLRTLYSVFCHGGFERHRVRGAAGRGVSAPADVGAVSIRHAARRRGSSSQGAAGCPRRSRHRARGGSHRRTAAAAPPIGRRACGSAAGRATVPARHTQTQQQGVGGAAYAWRRYAFRVRARLAALSPARPRRLEPGPSEHDMFRRYESVRLQEGVVWRGDESLRVVGGRVALPKVVRPRSPAGLLRAHALALLLGAAHSERRQLRGSQRLVPHVGLPDHVSTESSV